MGQEPSLGFGADSGAREGLAVGTFEGGPLHGEQTVALSAGAVHVHYEKQQLQPSLLTTFYKRYTYRFEARGPDLVGVVVAVEDVTWGAET